MLAAFEIPPKKARQPLSTVARAAASAKARATRAARSTKGSKQKAGINGDVTGVAITPIVSQTPAAPSTTTATPSASTSSATGGSSVTTPAVAVGAGHS
jgi:hypothetical protein